MIRRHAVAVAALIVAPVLCAGRASAQHHDAKPVSPPSAGHGPAAAKPAAPAEKPAAAAPPPKATPPVSTKKEAGSTELHAAIARIKEAVAAPVPNAAPASKTVPRPAPAAGSAARMPRIRLSWRASLMWPSELDPQAAGDSPDRLSLSWR